MEAERFVDRLELVDVDVEQRVAGGRLDVELPLRAALEDQPIHEPRERVVLATENPDRLTAHEFENADVAQLEVVR
jgi:hypothetical protein